MLMRYVDVILSAYACLFHHTFDLQSIHCCKSVEFDAITIGQSSEYFGEKSQLRSANFHDFVLFYFLRSPSIGLELLHAGVPVP